MSPASVRRLIIITAEAVLIVSQDVEDNKRTVSEFVPQSPSYYNLQVEVTCRLSQSNMWSMTGAYPVMPEDVREAPQVVLINCTVKHSYHPAETSFNCSASYTGSLLHRAFPFY